MNSGFSSDAGELRAALLAYQRSQGRTAGSEPAVQLPAARIRDVLQLASGRFGEGGLDADVQRAACFYIRSVLLRPGADHYALLGVERHADAADVKDHYRLMMRLLHPDFAAGTPIAWPADAASRVNLAYELLSSPQQRQDYDAKAAAAVPPPWPAATRRSVTTRAAAPHPPVRHPRQRLKQLSLLFGGSAAFALLVALLATGTTESLVQRAGGGRLPAAAPALPAPAAEPPPASEHTVARASPRPDPESGHVQAGAADHEWRAPGPATLSTIASQASVQAAPAPATAAIAAAPPAAAPSASVPSAPVDAPGVRPAPSTQSTSTAAAPTLSECHPVFAMLLQQMESGWGDRVLGMLDRQERVAPHTQALLERYNAIVDERRPVKLSNIAFSSQARDGRLAMNGRVLIQPRGETEGRPPRELAFEAEFASRDGRIVLTRLAPSSE